MGAPQKRARIATMAEPRPEDISRSIVVAAYQAREALARVARIDDRASTSAHVLVSEDDLEGALALLQAVCALLDRHRDDRFYAAQTLADRAVASVKSARAAGDVAAGYWSTDPLTEFDYKQRQRTQRRWQMAAEGARQDSHRLLAELAEVYPGAYDVEEL